MKNEHVPVCASSSYLLNIQVSLHSVFFNPCPAKLEFGENIKFPPQLILLPRDQFHLAPLLWNSSLVTVMYHMQETYAHAVQMDFACLPSFSIISDACVLVPFR